MEEIHIWDFPDNMYIRIPSHYRNIFFQLAFLEFGTTENLQRILKRNKLKINIFKWRAGKDRKCEQLVNLDAILFLRSHVEKRRNKIFNIYKNVKNKIVVDEKRISRFNDLTFLMKNIRYIFKGNENFAKSIGISAYKLISYINKSRVKRIPLNLIKIILRITEKEVIPYLFSLKELEDNIIGYKACHGKKIIPEFNKERKIPIKVTPEFESILYHLMGDGHVSEIGSSEYTQLNMLAKQNFLLKLYRTFGFFDISKKGFDDGRIYISKTIIKILCHYYKLNFEEFRWDKSALPQISLGRDNDFKLAGLIAFIVDEGYVGRSVITIYSSNRLLLSQIRQLTIDLDLRCSSIRSQKRRGTTKESFRLTIFKKSVEKLFIKANKLKHIYPTCNFSQKKERILKIVNP